MRRAAGATQPQTKTNVEQVSSGEFGLLVQFSRHFLRRQSMLYICRVGELLLAASLYRWLTPGFIIASLVS